jgi:hypothetical protein
VQYDRLVWLVGWGKFFKISPEHGDNGYNADGDREREG